MAKNIEKLRQTFYLDSDGVCRWEYVGMGETEMKSGVPVNTVKGMESGINLMFGICHVCGKNPLIYNYVLKYNGTEHREKYSIAGSECIQSLNDVDRMRIMKDKREMEEKHKIANGIVFGTYLRDVFNPAHQEIWKMHWEYYGHVKNLGGSVKYLWEKCISGVPMHEKTFGKELKQALKENGIELPGMREMKKILHIDSVQPEEMPVESGPTYDDFRADDEAIERSERAFETQMNTEFYANGSMDDMERGIDDMNTEYIKPLQTVKMVPEGFSLEDIYGISPITGKKEIVYVRLIDATGNPVVPDKESLIPDWDPVVEIVNAMDWDPSTERYEPVDIIHIHLKKWLSQNNQFGVRKEEQEIDPLIKALRAIAGDDQDHAQADNGVGFSGFDTEFGHSLASKDFLTEKQVPYAKKMVWKYRKQLQEHFPEIWEEVEGDVTQ